MKQVAEVQTKFGVVEMTPSFLEDGSLYVYVKLSRLTVNRVEYKGSLRIVIWAGRGRDGFQPMGEKPSITGTTAEYQAAYMIRVNNHEDASKAARGAAFAEVCKVANACLKDREFRQIAASNTERASVSKAADIEQEIEDLQKKIRTLEMKLLALQSAEDAEELFSALGV